MKQNTFRNFTYFIQKNTDGTFTTGMQWDCGSGWYCEKSGFRREQDAVVYIKAEINKELALNGRFYEVSL